MITRAATEVHNTRKMEQGAEREFERIFIEQWPRVYAVLVRLIGDRDEAEDIALETFWRLHVHPPSSRQTANLGGWLYRVATNLGLNALRARKRRARYELEAGQARLNHPEDDAVEELDAAEERERVRQVLARMDERQARLLLLRHSGLDYAELATTLEVSPNSIGTLLVRAEREFQKKYQELFYAH